MNSPDFYQEAPTLKNQYEDDFWLRLFLRWRMPRDFMAEIEGDLRRFGAEVAGPMWRLAQEAETQEPVHVPFDPWGRRIDEIRTSSAWREMHHIAAREGIVATAYERQFAEFSRLYQFVKLYLYHPSSALYSCPLAMTDGAVRVLELIGDKSLMSGPYRRLTSRKGDEFWTSGQWMTEKSGGSDVADTSTVAVRDGQNFKLYGTKWFTSAVTAEMALALARIEGAPQGSKGLSLFYLETRKESGELNQIVVHRLKDKLGTRSLPTAELSLDGTPARLIGEVGQGVRNVATMLNITRLYNSVCSVAQMRRALALVGDYARKRKVFGQSLASQPAFVSTFSEQKAHLISTLLLTFEAGVLIGKEETGTLEETQRQVLRLLTPIAKLYSGKLAVSVVSEAIEAFGGAGYVEDTGLPVLIRDAQVFPIWEGPTNVLSLDVLRVLQKPEALAAWRSEWTRRMEAVDSEKLTPYLEILREQHRQFFLFMDSQADNSAEFWQRIARELAFNMARLATGALLLELAHWAKGSSEEEFKIVEAALKWWCGQTLVQWPNLTVVE